MNILGQQIYEYRKSRGLSQNEMAKRCHINRSYLTEIENGKRIPGRKTLINIQAVLNDFF